MVNCNVQRIDQLFETKFASKMRQAYPRKAGEFYSRTRTGHSGRQRGFGTGRAKNTQDVSRTTEEDVNRALKTSEEF